MEGFETTAYTEQGYQRVRMLCIIITGFAQIKGLYTKVYKWVRALYNTACRLATNNWNALLYKRA